MLAFTRAASPLRAVIGLAALLLSTPASAGKLSDAGRATRTPPSSSSSSSSSGSSCDSRSHHHDGGDGELALWIVTSPWTIPNMALEPGERGTPGYEDYPYSRGSNGLLRYPEPMRDEEVERASVADVSPDRDATSSGKTMAAQVRAEGGYILGGVYRGGVGARLMTPIRLELDGNFFALAEPLVDGTVDRSTFANAHLGLRFAQSEHVQFRTGLGYQQYADQQGVEPGIDFFYGFEAEIGAHLVLAASGNLGSAGQAFVGQARATLGVMVGRFEIFAGYDHASIGGVPLGGPTAGVQAWL